MSSPSVEISAIVCHHKGSFIYKFVESCKKSMGVTFEIIVVTSDDALASVGIPGCTVINGPQLPAAKRNMGARIARGKYLAFFDDDVEIEKYCLASLKMNLITKSAEKCEKKEEPFGMRYGLLFKADEPERLDEAGGFLTNTGFIWSIAGQNRFYTEAKKDIERKIFSGKSASCMIDKELFNKIGGFDEDFGILGEESDLAWRVWLSGNSVWFIQEAHGIHYFNTKWKPAKDYYTSERVQYNGCRNYITMLIKNLEAKTLWKVLPVHIMLWVIAASSMFLTGKFTQSINIFRGLLYPIRNLRMILEKRRKVQSKRVVSDKVLLPIIMRHAPRGYYSQRFFRYLRINLHG